MIDSCDIIVSGGSLILRAANMLKVIMNSTLLEERLIRLETAIAHTQHDLEQINDSLLTLHVELKSYRQEVSRLERRLQTLGEAPEFRDPSEEQPPHY